MNLRARWPRHILTLGLCFLTGGLRPPAATAQGVPARINLLVVEGEGVVHRVGQAARDIRVKVEDDDHRPVSGASVVFALPISGATGVFLNNSQNLATVTDKDGLAAARGLRISRIPGKLQIYVTASYGTLRANTFITQLVEGTASTVNSPRLNSRSPRKWKWIALGVAAAGAAGISIHYLSTRTSSPRPPISISAGTVQFGSP